MRGASETDKLQLKYGLLTLPPVGPMYNVFTGQFSSLIETLVQSFKIVQRTAIVSPAFATLFLM